MLASTERILTTHTGSLPRPKALRDAVVEHERGGPEVDAAQVREAVGDVVAAQAQRRVDVVNDGEMSKVGYSTYVKDRLTGFEGEAAPLSVRDMQDYPELLEQVLAAALGDMKMPACTGEIRVRDGDAVHRDIANLQAAGDGADVAELFMTAASPGVIAVFLGNRYYPTHEAYLAALADAMKSEYDAIHEAGLVLQLDCPDLAMSRQMYDETLQQFRARIAQNVEALNHAVRDIPPERMRLHLCWGNYEGPHHFDVPLADILDIVLTARPAAIVFEAANPRHEHEWAVFDEVTVPDDKLLIPGVIDSTTNYIEHPELVAQRITRFAERVGRERVLAGSDCGFGTFAHYMGVHPDVAWAKLDALADGAQLATQRLW